MALALVVPLFLITPTNWWPRLVLWIFGLGLPCLALVLDRVGPFGPARLWAFGCLFVLIVEGLVAFGCSAERIFPAGHVPAPAAWFRADTWHWGLAPSFPTSAGTRLQDVLASDAGIILGPLGRDETHRGRTKLLGALCTPLGQRRLYGVGLEPTAAELAALRAQGARWLIWENGLPVPATVSTAVRTSDRVAGFWVMELR